VIRLSFEEDPYLFSLPELRTARSTVLAHRPTGGLLSKQDYGADTQAIERESLSAQKDLRIKGDYCNHTFFSYGSVSSSHARSSAISARSDQSDSRRPSLDDLGCSANARAASANFAKFAARPTTCSPVFRTSFPCRVTRTSSPLLVLRLPFPLLCISFARFSAHKAVTFKDRDCGDHDVRCSA
jgi:hypothetical protein